jgi:O-antigen/teichoic acid export membrane protein
MFLGVPRSLVMRLGWTTLGYGTVQVIRLLNNVILTRLLAPPIFGVMSLVNAIRTGIELLSDVGIVQNIVSNRRGAEPDFQDTAWSLQVGRGLLLGFCCILLARPLGHFFNSSDLTNILPLASLFFIFTGFGSTAHGLVQKELKIARFSMFEVGLAIITLVIHVSVVLITPTIWGLILASVMTGGAAMIITYLYIPGMRHRFMIDAVVARQLFRFGKWVFLSSIVYFFAMNFDRLYFAKQITFGQLGVYGIAKGLADMFSSFVVRCGNSVLFPTIAAAGLAPVDLRRKMLRGRRTLLGAAAVGIGIFLALAPAVVGLLYDARYQDAGRIVQILCVGLWFNTLTQTNDSILLGLGRAAYPALSNSAKLLTYVVGVPLAFTFAGFTAAIAVISVGEMVKYAALWALSHKEHLRFGRDDLALTLVFVTSALAMSELARAAGLGRGSIDVHALLRATAGF